MASFIGGEALARVVDYKRNGGIGSASWFTVHTVPAGRYAKVFIQYANSSSVQLGTNSLTGTDIPFYIKSNRPAEQSSQNSGADPFYSAFPSGLNYDEGDNIRLITGVTSSIVHIIIFEYNKPDTLSL